MNKQKIVPKYIALFAALLLLAVGTVFFIRWLYTPITGNNAAGSSNDAIAVFGSDVDRKVLIYNYSRNLYISIINSAIPTVEVCYETTYNYGMSGILASAFSRFTGGMHANLNDPLTYFNFVFSAFSSSQPYETAVSTGWQNPPDISNFEDAPEGAIYFSEEDEYTAEEAENAQNTENPEASSEPSAEEEAIDKNVTTPDKLELAKKDPQILIYHTHATESYIPNTAGNYHTLTEKYNVVPVGDSMAKILQSEYGYKVIHDKTYHDKESYVYSYANSLLTVKKYTTKYKSVKVILDLHRDAFSVKNNADKKAKKNEYTVKINGKSAAKIMLVIGQGNPNYPELEKYAVYIKNKMDKLYPGLFMKIDRKPKSKYNQYFSDYSMLVEVGCMLNTTEEAQYSGELMGNVIGEVLKDLKE